MMLVMHDQGNMNDFYKIVLTTTTTNGGYSSSMMTSMLCSTKGWSLMMVMTLGN